MPLSNHVTSLPLSIELRDAGWPQEGSQFYWSVPRPDGGNTENEKRTISTLDPIIVSAGINYGPCFTNVAAHLATELMDRMPYEGEYWFQVTRKTSGIWKAELYSKRGGWVCSFLEMELPDALAKLALHLIREGKMRP